MRRLGSHAHAIAGLVVAVVLAAAGLAPSVAAQGPDRSNVVLVFDFSASILQDGATRTRFGAALERIADRVDQISADLVAGDTTVSLVQFAAKAADASSCADLKLLNSPATVGHFADCLRAVATGYRKGIDPVLKRRIGIDTNYVAAMQQAAKHLPQNAERPALILFTDGKHDVKGVPVTRVPTTLNQLFGSRSPFALLPVGMGLDPKQRAPLAAGLERLRVIRNMPACVSGAAFEWPQVVFDTADQAGNAVAVALEDATCTFTAAPTPTPTPAPTPPVTTGILLAPGDGKIDVSWAPPPGDSIPLVDYKVRCTPADGSGAPIESKEGVSTQRRATVDGLTNGVAYRCEVAGVSASATGTWSPATAAMTPIGRPPAPAKPTVQAADGAVQIQVAPVPSGVVARYHYECSSDHGSTWPAAIDAPADESTVGVGNLTNGVDYTCRAFAENTTGRSEASPVSDAVRPCSSLLQCNPIFVPIVAGLGALLVVGLLAAAVAINRSRVHGYVVAVVDVVHTANIGHGSTLGISFVRDPQTRSVIGIAAERTKDADIRIRHLRGNRFIVRDPHGRHEVSDGDPLVIVDPIGVRHSLVLRGFATNAASEVASRR
ncbi:MAG TPA: fibronectin type III domain-containing protein [Candidatus Limnocylindrales bacterium]|nr:fibronectin type III domain-containing protein [Candidatus Limnocylindrales bacterium]